MRALRAKLRGALLRADALLRGAAAGLIRGYQYFVSPLLPGGCRFYPSCSEYALAVFRRCSFWRALRLTGARLLKCHPWHPGGEDLPPER